MRGTVLSMLLGRKSVLVLAALASGCLSASPQEKDLPRKRLAKIDVLDFEAFSEEQLQDLVAAEPNSAILQRVAERVLEAERGDLFFVLMRMPRASFAAAAFATVEETDFKRSLVLEILRTPWPDDEHRWGSSGPNFLAYACIRTINSAYPELIGGWRDQGAHEQLKDLDSRNRLADRFAAALERDAKHGEGGTVRPSNARPPTGTSGSPPPGDGTPSSGPESFATDRVGDPARRWLLWLGFALIVGIGALVIRALLRR